MPSPLRASAEARLDGKTHARLAALLTTLAGGGGMDRATFAEQFFGRSADDPIVTNLRTAALNARISGSPDALRDAADHLAGALQSIGLDRLYRFLGDTEARAAEPSTLVALRRSQQPPGQRDATRPVYPIEAAIGVIAAAITGGVGAAARAAAGAVARQILPEKPLSGTTKTEASPSALTFQLTRDIVAPAGRPVGVVIGRTNANVRTVPASEFAVIKDKLLQQATPSTKPRYAGTWYQRPDGSGFGLRVSKDNGFTIDLSDPNLPPNFKVHQK